jgi:hypothetical protein
LVFDFLFLAIAALLAIWDGDVGTVHARIASTAIGLLQCSEKNTDSA